MERQIKPGIQQFLRWCCALLCCWPGLSSALDVVQLELLLSEDTEAYRQLAADFQSELGLACAHRCPAQPSVRVSTITDWSPASPRDLLVTAGNKAALHALASHPPRLLLGLIPRSTWQSLNRVHPTLPGRASAVYLEQPVARQFAMLAIVLPTQSHRIGVVLGPESMHLLPTLRDNATRYNMQLVVRQVTSQSEVGHAVEDLSDEIDLLLAVPDSLVFNRDTLYGILLTSYGAGVPVAGYSSALVDAGAMLALYTSVPGMARHLAQASVEYLATGADLPEPTPSQYYEIAINRNVARSLGYDLPDPARIRVLLESVGGSDDAAQAAQ